MRGLPGFRRYRLRREWSSARSTCPNPEADVMGRIAAFVYGLIAYAAFLVTILYAIGFIGNLWVPKSLDTGEPGSVGTAVVVNLLLLLAFAVQHTIMARPGFKAWWTKFIPKAIERSTFVLVASGLLLLLFWLWQPIAGDVWRVESQAGVLVLQALFFSGWFLVFYSSFLIDHFDLFGLRQVFLHLKNRPYTDHPFSTVSLYKIVRHPLMLGFLIASWASPVMSVGHLVFAIGITGYILVGIQFEERDLRRALGEDYERYRQTTPALLPLPKRRAEQPGSRQPAK
jgi:protein-S-isoprenylcysteine O-methyltransferase Ste14